MKKKELSDLIANHFPDSRRIEPAAFRCEDGEDFDYIIDDSEIDVLLVNAATSQVNLLGRTSPLCPAKMIGHQIATILKDREHDASSYITVTVSENAKLVTYARLDGDALAEWLKDNPDTEKTNPGDEEV